MLIKSKLIKVARDTDKYLQKDNSNENSRDIDSINGIIKNIDGKGKGYAEKAKELLLAGVDVGH